jgi:hypothetical protein
METIHFSPYTPFARLEAPKTLEEFFAKEEKGQPFDFPATSPSSTTINSFIATQTPSYPPQLKSDSELVDSFFNWLYADETTSETFDYPSSYIPPKTEDSFSATPIPPCPPLLEPDSPFLGLIFDQYSPCGDEMPSETPYSLPSSTENDSYSFPMIVVKEEEVHDQISEQEFSIPSCPLSSKETRNPISKKRKNRKNSLDSIPPSCRKKQKKSSVKLSKKEQAAKRLMKNRLSAQRSRDRKNAEFSEYTTSHTDILAKIQECAIIYKFAHPEITLPTDCRIKSKLPTAQKIKLESEFIMKWLAQIAKDAISE